MNEDLIIEFILDQLNKVSKVKYVIVNDTVRCYVDGRANGSFPLEATKININFEDETVTVSLADDSLVRLTTAGMEWL